MFKLIFLCGFIALTRGATIFDEVEEYIVGGRNASINEVPYIVSMQSSSGHFCGGSIIAPTLILTAAHCCYGRFPIEVKFRAGSSKVREGGVVVYAKQFHLHPKFNYSTMDYDVAIVQVDTPLNYSKSIRPISLIEYEPNPGSLARVSGWGYMKEEGKPPAQLQTVVLPVVERSVCAERYEEIIPVNRHMICAGRQGKDSCQGDSGGPLALRGVLAGIVSFGAGCARRGFPGVYANVANPEIFKFINKFLKP